MEIIEKSDPTPLYLQLKNKIKKDIRMGVFKPGSKLPSETQLQKTYNLSRVTVRNAMKELTADGYIVKVQGKGSFVSSSDTLRLPEGVTSFTEVAKMQSVNLVSKIVKFDIENIQSDIDREFFGDKTGGKILVLKRVRIADGNPVTVEENHLSPDMITLKDYDLENSLYEILMDKYHLIPSKKGRRSCKITNADEETAAYLNLEPGTPIIVSEMSVFDVSGDPVHTVTDWVRGDNDKFIKWYI